MGAREALRGARVLFPVCKSSRLDCACNRPAANDFGVSLLLSCKRAVKFLDKKPELGHIGLLEFHRAEEVIAEGAAAAERAQGELAEAIAIFESTPG